MNHHTYVIMPRETRTNGVSLATLTGAPYAHQPSHMLTTTGRIIITIFGALIGVAVGFGVASLASVWFAPAVGAAIGAVGAYLVTTLLK